jgi:hypothetical protein
MTSVDNHPTEPTTRDDIRRVGQLAVPTRDPFLTDATDDELLAVLVARGVLVEEWSVGLRSVKDPGEVLGRWSMHSHAQAAGVCRDWRAESGGANYVVERHLGGTIFVVVPTSPAAETDAATVEAAGPDGDPSSGAGAPESSTLHR